MIRLAIVVEGETEEEFVKTVLADHLRSRSVEPQPIKPHGRGGDISVNLLGEQMSGLQWSFDIVTSLVDFYGFRGKQQDETVEELEERIDAEVDRRVGHDWDQSQVFAYVQRHEFEGLLFSRVTAFAALIDASPQSVQSLRDIRAAFMTPEDIDDGPATAPSKRIKQLIPEYRKRTYGPLLAQEIGLETIRAHCPRFGSWVRRLESLGNRVSR